jgi:hypothetical protein
MTLSAFGMVAAVVIFLGGALYFGRKPDLRTRLIGGGATLLVATVVGWFAWLAGTSA